MPTALIIFLFDPKLCTTLTWMEKIGLMVGGRWLCRGWMKICVQVLSFRILRP